MKSQKTLLEFIAFCLRNPKLRFWQALSVWKDGRIYISRYNKAVDDDIVEDTFYMD